MLEIIIPEKEYWDERKQEFVYQKEVKLVLEHSLVSVSKWEAIWKKPFLSQDPKTVQETMSYIKCMTISQNIDPKVYSISAFTTDQFKAINEYINASLTATTFSDKDDKKSKKEIITSELIYYWMVSLNIPIECQKWHLSRLLTLIKVCSVKNKEPEKMSKRDIYKQNSALNAARRKKLHTKG